MVGTLTKQKIKEVVRSSIMLLFQHSVQFKVNLNVEALIGVTLDEKDCFIISINETVDKASIGRRSQGQLANERNISSETAIGDYIPARPHIKKKKKRDARSPGGSSRQKKSRSESGENQFGDSEDTPINVNSPRDNEPDGGSGDADENVSNELESENNKSALDPVRLCTTYNNTNSIDTDSDHTVNYDIPASTSIGSIENTNTDSNTSNADRIGATLNPPCDRDDVVMIKSENDDSNTGLPIDQDAHIPQPIPASSWHTPQGSDGGPLMSGAGYPETKVPQNQASSKNQRRRKPRSTKKNPQQNETQTTSPAQRNAVTGLVSSQTNAAGSGYQWAMTGSSGVLPGMVPPRDSHATLGYPAPVVPFMSSVMHMPTHQIASKISYASALALYGLNSGPQPAPMNLSKDKSPSTGDNTPQTAGSKTSKNTIPKEKLTVENCFTKIHTNADAVEVNEKQKEGFAVQGSKYTWSSNKADDSKNSESPGSSRPASTAASPGDDRSPVPRTARKNYAAVVMKYITELNKSGNSKESFEENVKEVFKEIKRGRTSDANEKSESTTNSGNDNKSSGNIETISVDSAEQISNEKNADDCMEIVEVREEPYIICKAESSEFDESDKESQINDDEPRTIGTLKIINVSSIVDDINQEKIGAGKVIQGQDHEDDAVSVSSSDDEILIKLENENESEVDLCMEVESAPADDDNEGTAAQTSIKYGNIKPGTCFICENCDKDCQNVYDYTQHMKSHADGTFDRKSAPRNYKCQECDKTFIHYNSLQVHKNIHKGKYIYNCEICSRGFQSKSTYKGHMTTHGTDNEENTCPVCCKQIRYRYNLKRHIVLCHKIEPNEVDALIENPK